MLLLVLSQLVEKPAQILLKNVETPSVSVDAHQINKKPRIRWLQRQGLVQHACTVPLQNRDELTQPPRIYLVWKGTHSEDGPTDRRVVDKKGVPWKVTSLGHLVINS